MEFGTKVEFHQRHVPKHLQNLARSVVDFSHYPYKVGYLSSAPYATVRPLISRAGGGGRRWTGAFILKHVIPSSQRRGEQDGMEHGRREGGKADRERGRASELRESEIPVGMVPVICVMVPGL